MAQESKLSLLMDAIMEAGWLAAVIAVPIYFDIYSSRVFEPDKIALLRSIVIVMVAAWLTQQVDALWQKHGPVTATQSSSSWWTWFRRTPLFLPIAIFAFLYLVSTLFSVVPRTSFWGSYMRLQGTYTTYTYIVLFAIIAAKLRRREQLERLVSAIVITSIPISIYAMVQHTGLDPLPWGGDVTQRVAANMGNAIFVGAYLILANFFTLYRLLRSFASILSSDRGDSTAWSDTLLGGMYLTLFVIQLVALVYTQSRGPFLGWLAGMYTFVLVALAAFRPRHYRKLSAGWLGLAGLFIAFLVVFNLPNSPLEPLREQRYIGRLGRVLETEQGTGAVRVLIWEGAVQMILPHGPLQYPPDMHPDSYNSVRPLIGYGPESMWVAYNRFYHPQLAHIEHRNASPDRSHNETFDSLIITGAFGFLAYIGLFLSVFYYAMKWLGLIRDRKQFWFFLGLTLGGGIIAPLLAHQIDQGRWRFFGVAVPVGLVGGLILYLTYATLRLPSVAPEEQSRKRYLFLLTILAAIIAHFVEIHFGIAIVATRMYFWVMLALMLVVGNNWLRENEAQPQLAVASSSTKAQTSGRRSRRRKARQRSKRLAPASVTRKASFWQELSVPAILIAFVFVILAFLYTTNQFIQGEPANKNSISIIANSLFTIIRHNHRENSPYLFYLLTFSGIFTSLVLLGEEGRQQRKKIRWGGLAFLLFSGAAILGYLWGALFQALQLAHGAAFQQSVHTPSALIALAHIVGGYAVNFYWLFFFFLLLIAFALWYRSGGDRPAQWSRNGLTAGALVLFGVLAFYLIVSVNTALVRADVYFKQGQSFTSAKAWDRSIILYQEAIKTEPKEDYYYLFLGRDQLEIANRATKPADAEKFFAAALRTLTRAQSLNPLNTDHTANLARYYNNRAHRTTDKAEQKVLLQKAEHDYEEAVSLSPHSARLLDEWAMTLLELGQKEKTKEIIARSIAIDSGYSLTYVIGGDLARVEKDYPRAVTMYQKALQLSPNNANILSSLGVAYERAGQLSQAIGVNQQIVLLRPNDPVPYRNLALLYWKIGQKQMALQEANKALQLASDKDKPAIEQLIKQIKG